MPPVLGVGRVVERLLAAVTVVSLLLHIKNNGFKHSIELLVKSLVNTARNVPLAKGIVNKKVDEALSKIESGMLGSGDPHAVTCLPRDGMTSTEVVKSVRLLREGEKKDRLWGGIYFDHDEGQLHNLQATVFSLFNDTNALYPGVFPSIRKFEAEVISMAVSLLNGDKCGAVGLLTSGGTESILIAMYGYVKKANKLGIQNPEVICSVTAHPAVDKASHYFGFKLVKVQPDASQRLTWQQVQGHVTSNTIAVYTSAPSFAHGVVDDISGIAKQTQNTNIGVHVDNCLGGFYLSFLVKLGLFKKEFDFNIAGVTSISIDVHKYGMSPKGASVVAFRDSNLRKLTYCPVSDGATLYVTPTIQGARSGAAIAGAWSTLIHFGEKGYLQNTKSLNRIFEKAKREISTIEGLQLLTDSDLAILPLTSDRFDIYALASMLDDKGWNTFTAQNPPCLSLCIGLQHESLIDHWLRDVRECSSYLFDHPDTKPAGDPAVYRSASVLPSDVLEDVMRGYVDIAMTVKPAQEE